jgi:hypothetical protein
LANLLRLAANKAVRRSSRLFESMGFQVVAANYNSPIPRSTEMGDSLFNSLSDCVGIDWNQAVREEYLTQVFPKYSGEVKFSENPWISPIDATILHAMIRHHQPRKIVEVGSGYSTGTTFFCPENIGKFGSHWTTIFGRNSTCSRHFYKSTTTLKSSGLRNTRA